MYYLLVFLTLSLLSLGLIFLKNPFFSFALTTSVLLDSMLDSSAESSTKQKLLIKSLINLMSKFGILLFRISLTICISLVPMILYLRFESKTVQDLDMSSFLFFLSMIFGSAILFLYPGKSKNCDYSSWSILLHKMVLGNYNISKSLYVLDKKLFNIKAQKWNERFVIVTGLARGGTTALTNLLFESKAFHSLSYDNMPFLLAVNIWKKIYHPRINKLKQRAHGDNILFGYKTIEALEEYFFKVFLEDKFITNSKLTEHEIDENTYNAYLTYQSLLNFNGNNSTYLAKNNNLILRYKSLREFNPNFIILLIFRSPINHAYSLLNQHKRFSKYHKEDSFTLDYMNWLGHHEFGLNHKVFDLDLISLRDKYENTSINYWLAIWISYYTHILTILDDEKLILIEYIDLCHRPNNLISNIGNILNLDLPIDEIKPYNKTNIPKLEFDMELEKKSTILYNKLVRHKIDVRD